MPYNTSLEENGIYWQFYGFVTFAEIVSSNDELWGSAHKYKMIYQITDLTSVETLDMRPDQAVATSFMDKAASLSQPKMKSAIIATSEECILLANDYVENLDTPGWEARIFSELGAAREWIASTT